MGAAACKPCQDDDSAATTIKTVPTASPDQVTPVKEAPPVAVTPTTTSSLEGKWQRKPDGVMLGNIRNEQMIWEQVYKHEPSKLTFLSDKKISIFLEGQTYEGEVVGSDATMIRWSDGEMWVKVS
eukprot:TRINITY_DN62104_c0_g1_i1.p1 TRINITY_DN62104_c0_g1~~TRINITY_DN62104_c0_g1_i1.p1  ORF type:complete len:144 (-),score=26.63 TRINITY_DN62104_c0_g1_i1:106-480(-)